MQWHSSAFLRPPFARIVSAILMPIDLQRTRAATVSTSTLRSPDVDFNAQASTTTSQQLLSAQQSTSKLGRTSRNRSSSWSHGSVSATGKIPLVRIHRDAVSPSEEPLSPSRAGRDSITADEDTRITENHDQSAVTRPSSSGTAHYRRSTSERA